jgi:hypothetical protein
LVPSFTNASTVARNEIVVAKVPRRGLVERRPSGPPPTVTNRHRSVVIIVCPAAPVAAPVDASTTANTRPVIDSGTILTKRGLGVRSQRISG